MDDRPLAAAIGRRLRAARQRAGLTQQALAGERYTKAYISALETGVAKPSMAALNYLSGRLGMPTSAFVVDTETAWTRLDADVKLAQGDFSGALEAYEDLLATGPLALERAPLLAGSAEALCRLDRGHEAVKSAAEAVAIFSEFDRAADRLDALYWLAYSHHAADNHDEARALMRQVLDELGDSAPLDSQLRVRALIAIGVIEMSAGRSDAAIAYLREADGLAGELDGRRRATFLYALATAYRRAGDHEGAIRAGTQSLALFRSAEASVETAGIANLLALAYLGAGSHDQARQTASLGRSIADQAGDERLLAHIADTQARIELAADEPAAAARLADEAMMLARSSANQRALLDAMVTKARSLLELDSAGAASEIFAQAAELVGTVGPSSRRQEVLSAWADAVARAGDHARAYEIMREAIQPVA